SRDFSLPWKAQKNKGALPTFPPPRLRLLDWFRIQTGKELPPPPSRLFPRLILRLEKTLRDALVRCPSRCRPRRTGSLEGQIPRGSAWLLFAGEVVHRYRVFEQRVVAGDHGDAAFGDKIPLAVGLGIVADGRAFGKVHIAVNNGAANTAAPAHADMREQDGLVHFAVGIDPHVRRQDRILHDPTGDDATIRNDGIDCGTGT